MRLSAWRHLSENDKLPISTSQRETMPSPVFHTIGLSGKFGDPHVAETLNQIAAHLRLSLIHILDVFKRKVAGGLTP